MKKAALFFILLGVVGYVRASAMGFDLVLKGDRHEAKLLARKSDERRRLHPYADALRVLAEQQPAPIVDEPADEAAAKMLNELWHASSRESGVDEVSESDSDWQSAVSESENEQSDPDFDAHGGPSQLHQGVTYSRKHTYVDDGCPRPFKCTYAGCPWKFKDSGHLKDHMRIHTGEKPYTCGYCGIAKSVTSALHHHVVMCHERWRLLKCSYCSKRMPTESGLKRHERTHSSKMLCRCPECGDYLKSEGTLKNHRLTHADKGLWPYQCASCTFAAIQSQNFKRHADKTGHQRKVLR